MVLGTRFCRMVLGGATWIALGTCVSEARATESFRLTWSREGPADVCPSSEKLAREVAAKLGYDPFDDDAATEIRGVIQRHGSEWTVRIAEVKNGQETYAHESPPVVTDDCVEPQALAVHLVTVMIQTGRIVPAPLIGLAQKNDPPPAGAEPNLLAATLNPSASENKRKNAPVESIRIAERPSAGPSPRNRAEPLDTHVFLGGAVGLGILPAPAPAIVVSAGAGRGPFEVDAGMSWFPEARHPTQPFRFGLTAMSVAGCVRAYRTNTLTFLGCGAIWAGAMHVVGDEQHLQSFEATFSGDRAWFEFAASPRLRFVPAKPLTLQLGADVLFPFRYQFVIDKEQAKEQSAFSQWPVAVVPHLQVGLTIF